LERIEKQINIVYENIDNTIDTYIIYHVSIHLAWSTECTRIRSGN